MAHPKIKASVIGVTGFTGTELLRCLIQHPHVEIQYLVSRQHEGTNLGEVFPRLSHIKGLTITNTDHETVAKESDVVFLCLPHKAAQEVAPTFLGKTKLVDFSADFRLGDAQTYARYYHTEHQHPELLNGQFVYGLPEIYRDEIRKAEAVANPGCFALLVQLLLFPLKGKMSGADVIAISGTSGGGRAPRDPIDHPALSGNIRSYLINEHRHTPEILATSGLKETALNFTPTVGPFLRGIFANGFIQTEAAPDLSVFDGHPFVRLVDKVEMTNVVSTNFIDLSYSEGNRGTIIAQGALDNLLRGASGTAVQNMNLMFGFDETSGLDFDSPVYP
ncbi:MAG: N-acetyl-gamma-glutamyl-phosphate reductase [Rhodospirillales bacterium]|nr:N-acetyl-gamma-glutamyl-phosphate reductase [Alphaproteobacteria bacterium]USO02916.1 MAG: N-acetyl-gamma-glutamyl-phosphate reductase [Rhodospirillales bacterium]